MILIIIFILSLAFIAALFSMNDFKTAAALKKIIKRRNLKGTILFFKNKIVHY